MQTTSKRILITFCLQEDFLGSAVPEKVSPFHIGLAERHRLLGTDDTAGNGPVMHLMQWAQQCEQDLHVIHIKAWNKSENTLFGHAAIENTAGANLVHNLDKKTTKQTHVVHITSLNPFVNSDLQETISNITQNSSDCKIGVVGLWSESTITFLCYELITRMELKVATCSACTASKSRLQHFNALSQLQDLLNVKVFDSVNEFQTWLVPPAEASTPFLSPIPTSMMNKKYGITILEDGPSSVTEMDKDIISYLYRNSKEVLLKKLSGGFSGSLVFRVHSKDPFGYVQSPSIVKLGNPWKIGKERKNFERVEEILGNNAPQIRAYVELTSRAGIKFAYASMGGQAKSFEDIFKNAAEYPQERLNEIIQELFGSVLNRFYLSATFESIDLFKSYDYDGKGWNLRKGGSDEPTAVKERLKELFPESVKTGDEPVLQFPHNYQAPNVALFLQNVLPQVKSSPVASDLHFMSYVHGDLNGRNVIVDMHDNIYLIDFEYTERTHVLKDITKIENDIIYEFTDLPTDAHVQQAMAIVTALANANDLAEVPKLDCSQITLPELKRLWKTITKLRQLTAPIVQYDRNPIQMHIVLLRYALHMLTLDQISLNNKRVAAFAACMYADKIENKFQKHKNTLMINWIPQSMFCKEQQYGKLGLTLLPGRLDRGSHIGADMDVIEQSKVSLILVLCTEQDLEQLCIPCFKSEVENRKIDMRMMPIPCQGVPNSFEEAYELVVMLCEMLQKGKNVLLVSVAGLGRSGMIAALCLGVCGVVHNANDAIDAVRAIRSVRAIESDMQVQFIKSFFAKYVKQAI